MGQDLATCPQGNDILGVGARWRMRKGKKTHLQVFHHVQSQVSSPTRSAQKPSASGSCRMGPCLLCSHLSSSFHLCQGGALCLHKPRDGKLTCYQGHLCYRTVLIMRLRFLQLNWGLSPGTPPLSLLNTTVASLGSQNICTLCLIHLLIQYIFFPKQVTSFS